MSADDLKGMDVLDSDGEKFGRVSNIVLSPDQRNVHAVINIGSILGMGGRTMSYPHLMS
jgi:sporulation protein YlmC with PRC-barrel domain